jgi:hypothetical protein
MELAKPSNKRQRLFADDVDDDEGGLGAMPSPQPIPIVRLRTDGMDLQVMPPPPAAAPLENISLGAIAARLGSTDTFCWGCEHLHQPPRRDKFHDIWQLLMFVNKNLHTMSLQRFSVHLHERFKKLVWTPRHNDGHTEETNPDWPVHMIRTHFKIHDNSQKTVHMRNIHTQSVLQQYLETKIAQKNTDTQEDEPNWAAIKMLNQVSIQLHRLYTTDMDKIGMS